MHKEVDMTRAETELRHAVAGYLMRTARQQHDPARRGRRILLAARIERATPDRRRCAHGDLTTR